MKYGNLHEFLDFMKMQKKKKNHNRALAETGSQAEPHMGRLAHCSLSLG
jgi:hypothetical protein